jgi:hypothetical protein
MPMKTETTDRPVNPSNMGHTGMLTDHNSRPDGQREIPSRRPRSIVRQLVGALAILLVVAPASVRAQTPPATPDNGQPQAAPAQAPQPQAAPSQPAGSAPAPQSPAAQNPAAQDQSSQGTAAQPSPAQAAPPPAASGQAAPTPNTPAQGAAPQGAPAQAPAQSAQPQGTQPPAAGKPAAGTETPAVVVDGGVADTLLGKPVQSVNGDDMGRIVDVMVDRGGVIRAAIIDFGGFLGVGTRKIAVDWRVLHFSTGGSMETIVADLSRDQLRTAPAYKPGEPAVIVGRADTAPPAAPQPAAQAPAASSAVAPPASSTAPQQAAPQPAAPTASAPPAPSAAPAPAAPPPPTAQGAPAQKP